MVIVEEKDILGNYGNFQSAEKETSKWLSDILGTVKEIIKGIPWIIKKGDWVTVYNPSTGKWELWPKNLWEAMKKPVTAPPPAYTPTVPVYKYTPVPAPTPTPPAATPTYPPETYPVVEEKTTFEKLMPILMISGALVVLALLLTRK